MDQQFPEAGAGQVYDRPGYVTAAGAVLIALGGVVAGVGGALSAMAMLALSPGQAPEWAELPPQQFTGIAAAIGSALLAFGVAQVASGILVLRGTSWAQVAGIVLATLGAVLAAIGLLRGFGEGASGVTTIFFPVAGAYVYVTWALAAHPGWFARP